MKCLQILIMKNAPRAEKKIALPILPSVIPIFSAIWGMYVTQVLKIRLKQEYKKAEAKYFLFWKKNLIEIIPDKIQKCRLSHNDLVSRDVKIVQDLG